MTAEIRQAREDDIAVIAASLRPADAAELWACSRSTGEECMRIGLRHSDEAWTGAIDGEPVCMFGAVPASLLGGKGVPWMVGTTRLNEMHAQKALLRESKPALKAMISRYDVLANVVDDRNDAAKRWLRWLGFTVSDEIVLVGPDRQAFRNFEIRRRGDV